METLTTTLPRVPQDALDALGARIRAVRLPRLTAGSAAAPGPDQTRQVSMLERWNDGFSWRAVEDRVAALGYVGAATGDGRGLAAIHARADEASGVPILLIHGWPDSPLRYLDLIPLLTAAGHDVVAPAIPGFWFSDEPEGEMSPDLAAGDFADLMAHLGYERYAVAGGDWGSAVARSLAQARPEHVVALHLTEVPIDLAFTVDRETAGPAEVAYLESVEKFGNEQLYLGANMLQPTMVATVLADTPFGLATWLGSLYDAWSDGRIDDDAVIANAALMYLTGTARSSMRLYSEPASGWDEESWEDAGGESGGWAEGADGTDGGDPADWGSSWTPARVDVPTAFALFPADIAMAPRELAERHFAVERFTIMPRGGHFAAVEEPELLAADLLEFLRGR